MKSLIYCSGVRLLGTLVAIFVVCFGVAQCHQAVTEDVPAQMAPPNSAIRRDSNVIIGRLAKVKQRRQGKGVDQKGCTDDVYPLLFA